MTIRELTEAFLKKQGYGGLCNPGTGCYGCRLTHLFVDDEDPNAMDYDILDGEMDYQSPCADALKEGTCKAGYYDKCTSCSYNGKGHCKEYDVNLPNGGKNGWCVHLHKAVS